jgi:hypothetical protein
MGRTLACAAGSMRAMRPVPSTSSRRASCRARNDAPSADAAAVRRAVISLPSIIASGTPVRASYST